MSLPLPLDVAEIVARGLAWGDVGAFARVMGLPGLLTSPTSGYRWLAARHGGCARLALLDAVVRCETAEAAARFVECAVERGLDAPLPYAAAPSFVDSPLFVAARCECFRSVEMLAAAGAEPCALALDAALLACCRHGSVPAVRALLAARRRLPCPRPGPPTLGTEGFDRGDQWTWVLDGKFCDLGLGPDGHGVYSLRDGTHLVDLTPLAVAALHGHRAVVDELLGDGADARAAVGGCRVEGMRAAHFAAAGGHVELMDLLQPAGGEGADVPAVRLLLSAAALGRDGLPAVRELLRRLHAAGASGMTDVNQCCALESSVRNARVRTSELLKSTHREAMIHIDSVIMALELCDPAMLELVSAWGGGDVACAALYLHLPRDAPFAYLKRLVALGADVDSLMAASVSWHTFELVAPLLRLGADCGARLPTPLDWDAQIPDMLLVHEACASSDAASEGALRALIAAGADVDARDSGGLPALSRAVDCRPCVGHDPAEVKASKLRKTQMLIGAHADVNAPSGRPLDFALKFGSADIVRLLLEAGADIRPAKAADAVEVAMRNSDRTERLPIASVINQHTTAGQV